MFKRGLALVLVLGVASIANAGATFQVDILTAPNAPDGVNYLGGTTVDFGVNVAADQPIELRLLTLDFAGSDPALTFVGPDVFNIGNPGSDGIMEFEFDFSSLFGAFLYGQFPNYMQPNATYTGLQPQAGFILATGPGGLPVGTGAVQLPAADGSYTLDALNANGGGDGAKIQFDFTNTVTWTAGNGDITGNSPVLTVVPEPATLALIGLGGIAALRRRKK